MTVYSPIWELPSPEGPEPPDGPVQIKALADRLESNEHGGITMMGAGALDDAPESSPGSPGIARRLYFVSNDPEPDNVGIMWVDTGTGLMAVRSPIPDRSVAGVKLVENAVGAFELAPDSVGASELQADSVGSSEILAQAVSTSEIADALKPDAGASAATQALRALGLTPGKALPGDHGSVTNARIPTGAAGGDLADTYPNPTVPALRRNPAKIVVRAASNGVNSPINNPLTTLDTIALSTGDRILLKDQTTVTENGPYIYNGPGNPLTRTTDANANEHFTNGQLIIVQEGSDNNVDSLWMLTTNGAITLGTTGLAYGKLAQVGGSTTGKVAARVSRATTHTVPQGTLAAIPWTTEDFDPDGVFSSGANTRFTVPIDGVYVIFWEGSGLAQFGGVGQSYIRYRVNGVTIFSSPLMAHTANSEMLQMNAGDYLEVGIEAGAGPGGNNQQITGPLAARFFKVGG